MTPLERAQAMSFEQAALANMAVGQVLKFDAGWTSFTIERTQEDEWSLDQEDHVSTFWYKTFWEVWDVLSGYDVKLSSSKNLYLD
jgi:hypothetical protein